MTSAMTQEPAAAERDCGIKRYRPLVVLALILIIATGVRGARLARPSLWYDEVVTMEEARQPNPLALLQLLPRIDASEAPLQPLLLQGWLALFGASDLAGRAFSAACGVLTVAAVFALGRSLFDRATGLWAAWLCAVSPVLVVYSREVRMYAWLVLVTCLTWSVFVSWRGPPARWKPVLFTMGQVALFYSHPLGVFMMAAMGAAYLLVRKELAVGWRTWLVCQGVTLAAIAPWVNHYRHPPHTFPRYAFRFLVGMPIEYVGGNRWALLGCCTLIAVGMFAITRRPAFRIDGRFATIVLLSWFLIPPILLYAYSAVATTPVFGPARYTMFVAPAYLLLVARGLRKLPLPVSAAAALGMAALSAGMLATSVFAADLRPDWRGAGAFLRENAPGATLVVPLGQPNYIRGRLVNTSAESARYYLDPGIRLVETPTEVDALVLDPTQAPRTLWVGINLNDSQLSPDFPPALLKTYRVTRVLGFPLLRLYRMERRTAEAPRSSDDEKGRTD